MTSNKIKLPTKKRICNLLMHVFFQHPRVLKFKLLSTCYRINGNPKRNQPVQINGNGLVRFSKNVTFGVKKAPFFYNGYIYIDSRNKESKISFGNNVFINNNCSFISEGPGIEIGKNTLIGSNTEIVDSDFHAIDPKDRIGGTAKTAKVTIDENVFIGNNVKILKGVTIGKNSVIGNGSVVTKSVPENSLAVGVPAKIIKNI